MVELLDPTGVYFNGRVIAQGVPSGPEDGVTDVAVFKRLMQGLEGREPVLIIVDDSSAVWPNDKRNLFVVERYIYFPSSRKRFGMQGRSLLEIDRCADQWRIPRMAFHQSWGEPHDDADRLLLTSGTTCVKHSDHMGAECGVPLLTC